MIRIYTPPGESELKPTAPGRRFGTNLERG